MVKAPNQFISSISFSYTASCTVALWIGMFCSYSKVWVCFAYSGLGILGHSAHCTLQLVMQIQWSLA